MTVLAFGASSVILSLKPTDIYNDAIAGIAYSDADLALAYKKPTDSAWTTITPVTAAVGTYTSSGWVEVGTATGIYELGLPSAAVNDGGTTLLRLTYASNPTQYETLAFTGTLASVSAPSIRTAIGLASGNLDTQLGALPAAGRDALLNRVVAGNHDIAFSVGWLLQFLDALVSSRASSGALPTVTVQGTVSAASAGATSLTVAGLPLDATKYKRMFAVFEDGDNQAWSSEILATSDGTTIKLKEGVPAAVANGTKINIGGRAR